MQLLDRLREDFNAHQETVRALTDAIAENGGTASDEQQALLTAENAEIEQLVPRIQEATQLASRMHGAAEMLTGVPSNLDSVLTGTRRSTRVAHDSLGVYVAARANGDIEDDVRGEIERMLVMREATHSRALVDTTTADVPGLLPPSWLTDIVDFIGSARPFITAFDVRPLPPSGMTINFPQIGTRPTVGQQTAEKTDIPSQKTTVTTGAANVETYGGGEDVSVQVLQRTEPAYLGLMLELYAEQMARVMDERVVAVVAAGLQAPNKIAGDGGAPLGGFTAAAGIVLAANAIPDVAVIGTDVWQYMASAVSTSGQPLFPNTAPSNPAGSTSLTSYEGDVRGMRWVVDPNLDPKVAYIGWSRAFTTLVSGLQTLAADNPSKLGRDYAVFEMAAFALRRRDAIVQVTFTAPAPPAGVMSAPQQSAPAA